MLREAREEITMQAPEAAQEALPEPTVPQVQTRAALATARAAEAEAAVDQMGAAMLVLVAPVVPAKNGIRPMEAEREAVEEDKAPAVVVGVLLREEMRVFMAAAAAALVSGALAQRSAAPEHKV